MCIKAIGQQLQEVDPTLALGRREVGEQLVADKRAVAVLALVPRAGVIHLDMRRHLQTHLQQRFLHGMERGAVVQQDPVDLPLGNRHTDVRTRSSNSVADKADGLCYFVG
jgi:hypothetical protein